MKIDTAILLPANTKSVLLHNACTLVGTAYSSFFPFGIENAYSAAVDTINTHGGKLKWFSGELKADEEIICGLPKEYKVALALAFVLNLGTLSPKQTKELRFELNEMLNRNRLTVKTGDTVISIPYNKRMVEALSATRKLITRYPNMVTGVTLKTEEAVTDENGKPYNALFSFKSDGAIDVLISPVKGLFPTVSVTVTDAVNEIIKNN